MSSANPANATMPMSVPGSCRSMNAAAASSAAASRLGGMSVEHMLRDTSMTIRIVVWLVGTLTTAAGRASATTIAARDAANIANGRWRRTREVPGRAAATSDRLENRTAAQRRRRWTTRYSAMSAGTSSSSTRSGAHSRVMADVPATPAPPRRRGSGAQGRAPPRATSPRWSRSPPRGACPGSHRPTRAPRRCRRGGTCRPSARRSAWSIGSSSWLRTRKPSMSTTAPATLPTPTVWTRMPCAAAAFAPASGSRSAVASPSVSRTTTACPWLPGPPARTPRRVPGIGWCSSPVPRHPLPR